MRWWEPNLDPSYGGERVECWRAAVNEVAALIGEALPFPPPSPQALLLTQVVTSTGLTREEIREALGMTAVSYGRFVERLPDGGVVVYTLDGPVGGIRLTAREIVQLRDPERIIRTMAHPEGLTFRPDWYQ